MCVMVCVGLQSLIVLLHIVLLQSAYLLILILEQIFFKQAQRFDLWKQIETLRLFKKICSKISKSTMKFYSWCHKQYISYGMLVGCTCRFTSSTSRRSSSSWTSSAPCCVVTSGWPASKTTPHVSLSSQQTSSRCASLGG